MNTVDFYLRLSLEDDDLKDESNSITSQRQILKDFMDAKEEFAGCKVREHIDDGYTGTNFNRPGFQKMIELVKQNKVKTILVKDLSRFARNYIESGAYLEQIFPFMQVRFISVNDNYDSNDNVHGVSSLEIPFKNLVYDYYSKDISRKIRSSVKLRQEKGCYFGSKPPYGYLKDEKNHHQLIVDEDIRPIIEEIFKRYLENESMRSISQSFNKREVSTPGMHIGLKRGSGFWNGQTIRNILRNSIYVGTITGGKTRVKEVGSSQLTGVDSSEWIVRENMHEAIISKQDFEKVQQKLNDNENYISRERKHFHLLQDKIYCGHCHHKMSYTVHHGKSDGYHCYYRYKVKECCCMKGKITAVVLENIIAKEIQFHTEGFLKQQQTRSIEQKIQENICDGLVNMQSKLEGKKKNLQLNKMEYYEQYKQGIIEKEAYFSCKESLTKQLDMIEKEIFVIKCKIKDNTAREELLNVDKLQQAVSRGKLDKEWIDEVIDKIYVYEKDKVEIFWKFEKERDA